MGVLMSVLCVRLDRSLLMIFNCYHRYHTHCHGVFVSACIMSKHLKGHKYCQKCPERAPVQETSRCFSDHYVHLRRCGRVRTRVCLASLMAQMFSEVV